MSNRPTGQGAYRGPWKGVYAQFALAVERPEHLPGDGLPELALAGRSNVGKSSLINALLGMPGLARTSSTPGRTRALYFYRVWPRGVPLSGPPGQPGWQPPAVLRGSAAEAARAAGAFYLVDMPGYGYARVSHAMREAWARLIENYLRERAALRACIQIVDFRHPPTRDDIQMWEWLRYHGTPRLVVATKADKVGRTQWPRHERTIRTALELGPDEPLLVFSAETACGREELWRWVLRQAGN